MNRPLHLVHVFPTFGIGGTELRMAAIMNAIGAAARHTVIPLNGVTTSRERIRPPARVDLCPAPAGKGSWWYAAKMRRRLRSLAPDVLLTYNWGAIDAVFAGVLPGLCPVVHNECGFGVDESAGLKTARVLARRAALNHIHATVVVSLNMRRIALERFKIRPEKVRFIRTGVDVTRFRPWRNTAWRAERHIGADTVLFGYVGGLRGEKNLGLLLRAFAQARLPNACLALIGDGPCRAELERLAAELGVRGRVRFEGQVPDTSLCLAACDAFVMSSLTEQTPNALLEAMACGLPALATDVGDTGEILSACGWRATVASGDTDGYAARLAELARDAGLRRQIGAANRCRCESDFALDRMAREYAALYAEAAARGGRRLAPEGQPSPGVPEIRL